MNEYQLKKQAKELERQKTERKRATKRLARGVILPIFISAVIVGFFVWSGRDSRDTARIDGDTDSLSDVVLLNNRGQFHIHTQLKIFINGKEIPIPEGIGVQGHNLLAVHTHVDNGTLHMHKSGIVTKKDISLGKFFEIWGKTLTPECIFENCNNGSSTLTMAVNGKPSTEFGNYVMQDNDRILLSFGEGNAAELSGEHYNLIEPVDASE